VPIDATLGLRVIASAAFPVSVVLLWPRVVFARTDLKLAWIALAVAVAQGFLLAEAGPRIDHANLLPGASLAAFVVMVMSGAVLADRTATGMKTEPLRIVTAWTVFALHLWGGIRHVMVVTPPAAWVTPLAGVAGVATVAWLIATARLRGRPQHPAGPLRFPGAAW
jgi:hypothetical protein